MWAGDKTGSDLAGGSRSEMGSGIDMREEGKGEADASPAGGEASLSVREHAPLEHDRGLLLIGGFKLVEAVFFFLVGVGVIHFMHRDLGDAALRVAWRLRMDPEGRLVTFVLDHLDTITAQRMKEIGAATFFYAALRVAEGVGLILEKTWAEYLTVGLTVSFLPWEAYEILRRPDWVRAGLLGINLAVLAYLLWWLRRKTRRRVPGAVLLSGRSVR